MKLLKFGLLPIFWVGGIVVHAQTEIVPFYGMKLIKSGLNSTEIKISASTGIGVLISNEIPKLQEMEVQISGVKGWKDSAGFANYGCSLTLAKGGVKYLESSDIKKDNILVSISALTTIKIKFTIPEKCKAGEEIKMEGLLWDKKSTNKIKWEMRIKVLAEQKKLPEIKSTSSHYDSKGLMYKSAGLKFNFYEFKGITGNNFVYRIKQLDPVHIKLKGLSGFKSLEGKYTLSASIKILDKDGNELETATETDLQKQLGENVSSTKQELELKYKTKIGLESGTNYIALIKIKDQNNPKSIIEIQVRFLVE